MNFCMCRCKCFIIIRNTHCVYIILYIVNTFVFSLIIPSILRVYPFLDWQTVSSLDKIRISHSHSYAVILRHERNKVVNNWRFQRFHDWCRLKPASRVRVLLDGCKLTKVTLLNHGYWQQCFTAKVWQLLFILVCLHMCTRGMHWGKNSPLPHYSQPHSRPWRPIRVCMQTL